MLKNLFRGATLAAVALSLGAGLVAGTAQADVSAAVAAPARQTMINHANALLLNPQTYKVGGGTYNSTPSKTTTPRYNYLGRNGSNENRNEFNKYNGDPWCGWFAKAVWTISGTKANTQLPSNPASSQAWRTDVGNRFHAYSASRLPAIGDVLVWTNKNNASQGHVAVVTSVNPSTKMITTIGGNEGVAGNSDSIVERRRNWTQMAGSMSGKTFRGFASVY